MTRPASPLPYAAAGLAVLVWGASPAAIHFVARDMPSAMVGVTRLLCAVALLTPIMLALRPPLPRGRDGWIALVLSGVVGFAVSFVLQGVGIARTTTAHAGLIFAAAPILTGFLQFLRSRAWPGALWWVGCVVALAGEAVLILGRNFASGGGGATLLGDLILVAGTVTVSMGYVAGARLSSQIGLFAATAWSIVAGAVVVLPAAPFVLSAVAGLTVTGWWALAVLVALCTLVGYAAWFWALDRGGAANIAPIQFAMPVTSLVIAVVVLSEELSWTVLVALVLVLSGVGLSRRAARPAG